MNPCIKTGCTFEDCVTGARYHGDLFHDGEAWQVRGFQAGAPTQRPADIVVSELEIRPRPSSRYSDTNPGIVLVAVTDEFREFVRTWSPHLVDVLPAMTPSRKS